MSAGERGIVLKISRLEATAEAALTATVKRPLEPAYVRAEAFKAAKDLPLAGCVEIALGGEPAKAEATGEVKHCVSVVRIRAVGEIEYAGGREEPRLHLRRARRDLASV